MKSLEFEVTGQFINRVDQLRIVSDTKNYLYCHFTFKSEEWEGKVVTALFTKGTESYIMLLDITNDCPIPWELMQEGGDIYVSVYSGDLVTTNKSRVTVYDGGYTEDAENSLPPTPNIYSQITESIAQLRQDLLILDGGTTEDWEE